VQTASPTSSGKEKAVKKIIKTAWRREDGIEVRPESGKMAEFCTNEVKEESRQVHCNGATSCEQNKQCTTESSGKSTSVEMSTGRRKTCKV